MSELLDRAEALHLNTGMRWDEARRLALSEAGIDDAAIEELCGECASLGTETLLTGDEIRDFARAVLVHGSALLKPAEAAPKQGAAGKWDGAEEWMPLAWALCADECGEDACTELVWEGGAVPEPWGDRWLKYEGEAKRLIALVREHVPALSTQPQQPAPEPVAWLCELAQEDGSTRTQIVTENPDGLRWNDAGEPSPFRVTPLYTAPQPPEAAA